jgi:hypothetical protein
MKGLRLLLYLGVGFVGAADGDMRSADLVGGGAQIATNTGIIWSRRRIRFRKNICRRADFSGAGEVAFLQGYLRKTVSQTWYFGGEFVVICMVNVVA